jgi:hypothetical protein
MRTTGARTPAAMREMLCAHRCGRSEAGVLGGTGEMVLTAWRWLTGTARAAPKKISREAMLAPAAEAS